MKQEKRLYWIDIIKIIACFCVLVNHTGGYLLEYNNENTVYIIFYLLQFSICKLGVPIFIMITGFLLLNKNDSYKQIFKRIIRILIPLLIISIYVYINYNGIKKFDLGNFILRFLQKPLITPFWYLYMLIGIYIITPFIKKMIDNFNHNDFKIFFLLTLVIPGLLTFISTFSRIKFSSYFTDALFPISIVYYISGIFLSKVDLNKKNLKLSIVGFIFPTIIIFLTMYTSYLKTGTISYTLDSWIYITTASQSLSLFYIIRYMFENKKIKAHTIKIISEISKITFGVYLFHYLINNKIYNLIIIQKLFSINGILGIISLEILCFTLCGVSTFLLKKIPYVKKYL